MSIENDPNENDVLLKADRYCDQDDVEAPPFEKHRDMRWSHWLNCVLVSVSLVPALLALKWYLSKTDEVQSFAQDIYISASNKYGALGLAGYPGLEALLLIEPHRETTFCLEGTLLRPGGSSLVWGFRAEQGAGGGGAGEGEGWVELEVASETTGECVTASLPVVPGGLTVTVKEVVGAVTLQMTAQAATTKYVRRELRALAEDDRAALLDAMRLLWEVPREEGAARYGGDYRSAADFLALYARGAGAADCDHFGQGPGALTQHAALTAVFERALQAVDPALALPYWDFFADAQAAEARGQKVQTFVDSEVFSAEYFGTTDPQTGYIMDGRWSNITVPTFDSLPSYLKGPEATAERSLPTNPYGFVRSPWAASADPRPRRFAAACGAAAATAGAAPPDCAALAGLMALDSAGAFLWELGGSDGVHALSHLFVGGSAADGCAAAYDGLLGHLDEDAVGALRARAHLYAQRAYRAGYLACDAAAAAGAGAGEEEEAVCGCADAAGLAADGDRRAAFLAAVGLEGAAAAAATDAAAAGAALVAAVCGASVDPGEALQASAAWAPEFWALHPALERLLQEKHLRAPFEDPAFPRAAEGEEVCRGHGADDLVLLGAEALDVGKGPGGRRPVTNAELLELLRWGAGRREAEELGYVYDRLDAAAACRGEGGAGRAAAAAEVGEEEEEGAEEEGAAAAVDGRRREEGAGSGGGGGAASARADPARAALGGWGVRRRE